MADWMEMVMVESMGRMLAEQMADWSAMLTADYLETLWAAQ